MDFSILTNIDVWWIPVFSGPHTVFMDVFAQVLTCGWTWIVMYVLLFFIVIKNNESMAQIGLVIGSAAVCILLTDGLADGIVKPLVMRPRPINDPAVRPLIDVVAGVASNSYSFFSAHAANTMGICVFFSLLTRSPWMAAALTLWSLTNCWTRIYLGMHYPSDIIVGLIWGGMVGTGVYFGYKHFYNKVSPRLHFISSQYTRSGYALGDINMVINVMLLTVVYAIIRSLLMV